MGTTIFNGTLYKFLFYFRTTASFKLGILGRANIAFLAFELIHSDLVSLVKEPCVLPYAAEALRRRLERDVISRLAGRVAEISFPGTLFNE